MGDRVDRRQRRRCIRDRAWANEYAEKFVGVGFGRGVASPVVFYDPGRDVACVVHVDDFTFCAADKDLDWIEAEMQKWFQIEVRARLGLEERDSKKVVILGRRVIWKPWGVSYEADPKHRDMVLEELGIGLNSKGLSVTGVKEELTATTSLSTTS